MTNPRQGQGGFVVGLLFLVIAGIFVALNFEITTSIAHFLPVGPDRRLVEVSRAVANSELTKTVVLTIGGPDEETAAESATELADRLRDQEIVTWVQNGATQEFQRSIHELYFPRRFLFLSNQPERELPERLSKQGLNESLRDLKRQLRLPTGSFIRRIAPEDPLLFYPALLDRLQEAQSGGLELRGSQFVTSGGRGVLFLGGRGSPYDTRAQRAIQDVIHSEFSKINRARGNALDLAQSGAGRFAIAAETSIKSDVTRISLFSSLGIVLLFLLFFRSLRALILVVLPLAAGVLGAAALTLFLFGRIHGLTLAFGSTLIGVCIDFAVHLQSHQALVPHESGPRGTLKRIWPALLLGGMTTVAGLGLLAWTTLPGIREIAIFSSSGVVFALAATHLLLPPLLPRRPMPKSAQLFKMSEALGKLLESLQRNRRWLALFPATALLIIAIALPRLSWIDDVTALQTVNPELLAEEERVREQISRMESARIIIAYGENEEVALRRNDALYLHLEQARREGVIGDFRSLHPLLPSAELQRQNFSELSGTEGLQERLETALLAEGFRPQLFAPFAEAIESLPPEPLTFTDLAQSPLADLVRPFRITVGDQVAILTFLRQVNSPDLLRERLSGLNDTVYFDQVDFLGETYRFCRTRTLQLMCAGLLAVFLLVLARYRRISLALAAFTPSLLAAALSLVLVTLLGSRASLLHLLGLLLVLSMGVDYGVFMVESRRHGSTLAATSVSILIACLSTVLAFGLLALSSNPALRAMGITTGMGVFLSLLLAPTVFVLLKKPARDQ